MFWKTANFKGPHCHPHSEIRLNSILPHDSPKFPVWFSFLFGLTICWSLERDWWFIETLSPLGERRQRIWFTVPFCECILSSNKLRMYIHWEETRSLKWTCELCICLTYVWTFRIKTISSLYLSVCLYVCDSEKSFPLIMWICNIFLPPDNTNQLDFKSLTLKELIVIGLEIS